MSYVEVTVDTSYGERELDNYPDSEYEVDPSREHLTITRGGKAIAHYPRLEFKRVRLVDDQPKGEWITCHTS